MSFRRESSSSVNVEGILNALRDLERKELEVGWFESAKYPDGVPVAYVMSIQEYGSIARAIPPRPFFMPTIESKREEWTTLTNNFASAIISGRFTPEQALNNLGVTISADVRGTINNIREPPLSPRSLRQRRRMGITSDTPLRRTGYTLSTLTYVVS